MFERSSSPSTADHSYEDRNSLLAQELNQALEECDVLRSQVEKSNNELDHVTAMKTKQSLDYMKTIQEKDRLFQQLSSRYEALLEACREATGRLKPFTFIPARRCDHNHFDF